MRQPRIVFLASHAIQYQVPAFLRFAREDAWDTSVVYLSRNGLDSYHDAEFDITVQWPLPDQRALDTTFLEGRNRISRVSELYRAIFRPRPALVVVFGWGRFEYVMVLVMARLFGVRSLVVSDATGTQAPRNVYRRAMKRLLLMLPRYFGVIGQNNRAYYQRHGVADAKFVPWPYAVDNEYFLAAASSLKHRRESLRREILGDNSSAEVLLYVGKLTDNKNIETVAKAFCAPELSHAMLVIVGDGVLRDRIRALAAGTPNHNIRWLGFRNQDEIGDVYAMADALILVSTCENWGLVVNEAMHFGIPVLVGEDVGCAPDLVIEGETGVIYHKGTPLVEAILSVLALARRCDAEAITARVSGFSYDRWIDTVRRILEH